jgi:hypothetical protein
MRRLILIGVSLMSLFGGVVRAQEGCDLNAQIDALYEAYTEARGEDAVGAAEALQTGLADVLATCEPAEATPISKSSTVPTPGHWHIDWASETPTICQGGNFRYTPRDLNFLLEVEGDHFTATDHYAWPPLMFAAEPDGVYAAAGTQTVESIRMDYNYQVTVISPERIEGTTVAELGAIDCTIRDSFVMTLVDETVTCMVNTLTGANLRSGPGTTFERAGVMPIIDMQPVLGQAGDSDGMTWWQLADDSWVRSDLVAEAGDCEAVPVV